MLAGSVFTGVPETWVAGFVAAFAAVAAAGGRVDMRVGERRQKLKGHNIKAPSQPQVQPFIGARGSE